MERRSCAGILRENAWSRLLSLRLPVPITVAPARLASLGRPRPDRGDLSSLPLPCPAAPQQALPTARTKHLATFYLFFRMRPATSTYRSRAIAFACRHRNPSLI